MAKLKFRDENKNFIPVVQDVKVNNNSVFDGENADIRLKTINNESIIGTGNIDIEGGEGEYVKYTPNQNLTTQQKLNARNNINAFSRDEVKQQLGTSTTDVISQKGVTDEINKKQDSKPDGRNNLIANDTGKLNVKYLPATVLGGITYGGTFNDRGTITASSYAPELDGLDIRNVSYGTYPSFYFIYSGPETVSFFGSDYSVGDMALSTLNGWAHLNSTDAVTSVNGKIGAVILNADDIGAVLNHWGIDNRNKNLVTDAFGAVTVSDFSLGQILVDNYLELPNVNPEAPHQDIPENARATVARTIDVYPNITVNEFQDALDSGEQLDKTVIFFNPDADNRPVVGSYASLSNDDYNFYVGYDDNSTLDSSYRVEVSNNNTGDYFEMIYSFKQQVYINDESITLNPNVWTKITTDPDTGDYVATETDHNDIPNLANPYVSDMYEVDSAFMKPITWDKTYLSGDYMYVQQIPYTDPPTFYWKYTPSNVQSNMDEEDSGSLAYILNRPRLRSNITSGLTPQADELIKGQIKLHKISKTGNYADLRNQVGQVDEVNGGEIFGTYTGQHANQANSLSLAEGLGTVASASACHAEGSYTTASGASSHAEGNSTYATNIGAHSEGQFGTASGNSAHVEGISCQAQGPGSHAEGGTTTAVGDSAHAEGTQTVANGNYSHAEGQSCSAGGTASHAEGANCSASSACSHAEGSGCQASAADAHAEGMTTVASGQYAHAEGGSTQATAIGTHAEGYYCRALFDFSHAEGYGTATASSYAHAQNLGTIARYCQTAIGKYNIDDVLSDYALVIGNGTDTNNRANEMTVDWNGNAWFLGDIKVGGTNYSTGSAFVEKQSNKVTSISASSTDDQYPTAKCVYDIVGDIESLLQGV